MEQWDIYNKDRKKLNPSKRPTFKRRRVPFDCPCMGDEYSRKVSFNKDNRGNHLMICVRWLGGSGWRYKFSKRFN